jgi:hypothetical protein
MIYCLSERPDSVYNTYIRRDCVWGVRDILVNTQTHAHKLDVRHKILHRVTSVSDAVSRISIYDYCIYYKRSRRVLLGFNKFFFYVVRLQRRLDAAVVRVVNEDERFTDIIITSSYRGFDGTLMVSVRLSRNFRSSCHRITGLRRCDVFFTRSSSFGLPSAPVSGRGRVENPKISRDTYPCDGRYGSGVRVPGRCI